VRWGGNRSERGGRKRGVVLLVWLLTVECGAVTGGRKGGRSSNRQKEKKKGVLLKGGNIRLLGRRGKTSCKGGGCVEQNTPGGEKGRKGGGVNTVKPCVVDASPPPQEGRKGKKKKGT